MPWFEVFIPGRGDDGFNVTLTLDAPNWIGALRTGLKNIGEGAEVISNVMCDIKEDNSIHVTDVQTKRVFRLREVAAPARVSSPPLPSSSPTAPTQPSTPVANVDPRPVTIPPMEASSTLVATPAVMPPPSSKIDLGVTKTQAQFSVPIPKETVAPLSPRARTEPEAPKADVQPALVSDRPVEKSGPITRALSMPPSLKPEPAPPPRRITGQFATGPQPELREESQKKPTDPRIGRDTVPLEMPKPKLRIDDVIADVFDATQDLLGTAKLDLERVANQLLDLALQKIPADAGSFYVADVNGHELRFVALRGPKADAIKRTGLAVPVGQGIIGFCAQEGVCLCVSDIQNDPRYFSAIADAVGYSPRDTLCASAEKDGRLFGAIQLLNSKGGSFDATEMEVLRYIGLTAAEMLERIADA